MALALKKKKEESTNEKIVRMFQEGKSVEDICTETELRNDIVVGVIRRKLGEDSIPETVITAKPKPAEPENESEESVESSNEEENIENLSKLERYMLEKKKKQQEGPAPQVEARIDRMVDGDYKTKAYASVTIAGAFAVHGLRVIETDKGRFISMPQESYKKNGETVYNDTFHAVTAEARTALVDAVNDAYEQRLQERMEQSEDVPAQGMEQQM